MGKRPIDEQKQMMAYLLGELSSEDQSALECSFLAADDAFERLLALEDELAYDYVQGRLAPAQRRRFEEKIASTGGGRAKVEFARSLIGVIELSRTAPQHRWIYWIAAMAAALVLAAAPAWLALRMSKLGDRIEQLSASVAARAPVPAEAPAAKAVSPLLEATFLLTANRSRSADEETILALSPQAGVIRYELVMPPGAEPGDYAVVIRAADGAEVWSGSATLAGPTLKVTAPAALFTGRAYRISVRRLTAGEPLGDIAVYSFRFVRR